MRLAYSLCLPLLLLSASCFNPDLSTVCSLCDPDHGGACPPGQACDVATRQCQPSPYCKVQAVPPTDAGAPGPTWPPTCHLYDGRVSQDFAYCTGAYAAGKAATLCPQGWHVCGGTDPLPAGLAAACSSDVLGGFMVSDVPSYHNPANPTQGSCQAVGTWQPGLAGCGRERPQATFVTPICLGWQRSLICGQSQGVSCPGGTLATAANVSPGNGVSCCK